MNVNFVCLYTWLVSCLLAETLSELCQTARNRCVSRVGCGMALHNYILSCGNLIYGRVDQCTQECQQALVSLLSTEDHEGEVFMTCGCAGEKFCESQRQRIQVCSHNVLKAMSSIGKDENIECTLAYMICNADTACQTALHYYSQHCKKLTKGIKCTAHCNNSVSILYRQSKGRQLRTCICDGKDHWNVPCQAVQDNIERLCFGQEPPHRHRHHHSNQTRSPPYIRSEVNHNTQDKVVITLTASASVPISYMLTMVLVLLIHSTW